MQPINKKYTFEAEFHVAPVLCKLNFNITIYAEETS